MKKSPLFKYFKLKQNNKLRRKHLKVAYLIHVNVYSRLSFYFYLYYTRSKLSLFPFLDCGRSCTSGTLSSDCMYCICSDTITGQIRSNLGRPLINATITPLNTPDVILDLSDDSGMFELTSACSYQTYTFYLTGFVDSDIIFNQQSSTNVTLNRYGNSNHRITCYL